MPRISGMLAFLASVNRVGETKTKQASMCYDRSVHLKALHVLVRFMIAVELQPTNLTCPINESSLKTRAEKLLKSMVGHITAKPVQRKMRALMVCFLSEIAGLFSLSKLKELS
jgi:hypothetical protein